MSKLTTAMTIAGLLAPLSVQALGVGEIRPHSYLNQPLRAEIPLVLSTERLDDLKIELASPKDFAAAGLERTQVLSKLRFSPVRKPDGGFVIRVGSSDVIHEPFLSFLLEVSWPQGRMLRTFTVLLDPPDSLAGKTFPTNDTAAVVDTPSSAPSGSSPLNRPSAISTAPVYESATTNYGPVGRNEKLWSIARRLNEDPSITPEQMVVALFRYNPQAFSRSSVNALNAGTTLRIPPKDFILELSPREARDEFFRQQRGRPSRWAIAAPSGYENRDSVLAENHLADSRGTAQTEGYEPTHPAPRDMPASAANDRELRAYQALQRESAEMRKRLAELEKRVAELQLLFNERELLADQGRPRVELNAPTVTETAAPKNGGLVAAAPPAAPAATPNNEGAAAAPLSVAETTAPSPSPAPISVQAPNPTPSPPTPSAQRANPTTRLADGKENAPPNSPTTSSPATASSVPWILAAAGTSLAALAGLYYWQRRRALGATADLAPLRPRAGAGDQELDTSQSASTAEASVDANPPSAATIDPQDVDAIFESDIYLSYGKIDQALETIENAIRRSPKNEAFRLKLLEILAARGDAQRFREEVTGMEIAGQGMTPELRERIRDLGEHFPAGKEAGESSVRAAERAHIDGRTETDDTDRLIDNIKEFSIRARNQLPTAAAEPNDPETTAPRRTETSSPPGDDDHSIAWLPTPKVAEPGDKPPPSRKEEAYVPGESDGVIQFDRKPDQDADSPATEFEDLASESIDNLLKELSALHYERRCSEDGSEEALPQRRNQSALPDTPSTPASIASGDQDLQAPEEATPPAAPRPEAAQQDVETKLDLARAYIDMGDHDQARDFLAEVMNAGSESQKAEATSLLASLAKV